jgi:transcriptional regulator
MNNSLFLIIGSALGFIICWFFQKISPKSKQNISKLSSSLSHNLMTSYTPKHFQIQDKKTLINFIKNYNFGMLIHSQNEILKCSHIPFVIEEFNEKIFLHGHVAKSNSIFEEFERMKPNGELFHQNSEFLILFNGPHEYISPNFYLKTKDEVPTWDYTSVHCYGIPKMIENESKKIEIMRILVNEEEEKNKTFFKNYKPWKMEFIEGDNYFKSMMERIYLFTIEITKIEGKFKLSQNKSQETRLKIIGELKEKNSEFSNFMEEFKL